MHPKNLAEARCEIEAVDKEMAALFERRMHACAEVAAYKKAHDLPVLDAAREEENRTRNVSLLSDASLKTYYLQWYQETMEISKQYQRDLLAKEA
jgi:chorismate mutase/prephenate dehydratase